MATWLNHVAIAAPRNGSTDHTVDPNGGVVVAGANFVPTAGRRLVVFASGSVTSTTPAGWTLPTNGSAINNSGLYVWHRVAAGSDTFTSTHNSSDYPVLFDIYEFAAGTTFVGSASSAGAANGGAGPTLSSLTGTNWTAGVLGQAFADSGSHTVSWNTGAEATDTSVQGGALTDGYVYGLTYTEDNTASSQAYTGTSTQAALVERLVIAVNIPSTASAAGDWYQSPLSQAPYALVSESAPWGVRAFQPPIPMETWPNTGIATQDATVAAVAIATATAMPAPAIQTGSTVAATAIATMAAMSAPTITAVTAHTATVIATTTGMPAPAVQTGSVVAATVIATTTAMPAPVVGAVTAVTPPVIATVTALPAPAVQTGSVVSATTLATVTALPVPVVDVAGNATVAAVAIATATALPAPVVQQGQVVSATSIATVTALPVPVVQTGSRVNPSTVATVTALTAPTVSVQTVVAAVAVATVTALPAPTVKTGSTVAATVVGTVIVLPVPVVESNVVSGIQGSVYPRPGSGATGNVYPQSSGGIIGSVA